MIRFTLYLLIITTSASGTERKEQLVHNQVSADLAKVNSVQLKSFKQAERFRGAGGFVSVGPGGNCDFNVGASRIQDAIDSGASEIRVASNDTYMENLTIDDVNIIIRGGYDNCTVANSGGETVGHTTIDGSVNPEPVFEISGDTFKNMVVLENLIITNSLFGGINTNSTDVTIELTNSFVSNNSRQGQGGGVSIFSGDTDFIARDVVISQNTAIFGGGIGCQGFQASLLFLGDSSIQSNSADGPENGSSASGSGGGLFMAQACTFSMYSGSLNAAGDEAKTKAVQQKGLVVSHFINNQANSVGGAINSINTSKLFLFGQQMCVGDQCLGDNGTALSVINNESDLDQIGGGNGGAVRLFQAGNEAVMNGVVFQYNESGGNGGAFALEEGAALTIYREPGNCWNDSLCNAIVSNESTTNIGFGGAINNDNAISDISSTVFALNRADFGTVLYSTGSEAVNRFEGVTVGLNGNDGADDFSDNYVMYADFGSNLEIIHASFADNRAQSSVLNVDVSLGSTLNLQSSIIHDLGSGDVLTASGPTSINCIMAHESASFSGTNITVDDPEFIDVLNLDFGLNPLTSPAIDFCDDAQVDIQHLDINNNVRGWDDPSMPNLIGPFDLGAVESYSNDIIFEDGFEG